MCTGRGLFIYNTIQKMEKEEKVEVNIKNDALTYLSILYHEHGGYFRGTATVKVGIYEIKVHTEKKDSPDETLADLKKLLIETYVKFDLNKIKNQNNEEEE